MKKIPTVFRRWYDHQGGNNQVVNEIIPECKWVIDGLGYATEKLDGTACLWWDNRLYRRYSGRIEKQIPSGFVLSEEREQLDKFGNPVLKRYGWVPISLKNPSDKHHVSALAINIPPAEGTYELIGPKINSNPYGINEHYLVKHGLVFLPDAPRDYLAIYEYLKRKPIEGIVWYHPNGMMAKIKRRDFGISWPEKD